MDSREALAESRPSRQGILEPGRNCWAKPRAGRVSFLIDGEAYFSAFKSAAEAAERTIYIAGWDIDSRISLLRDSPEHIEATRLAPFLDRLVRRKRKLRVYILAWDFSMVFALDRELFLELKMDWTMHRRVRFRMDSNHPIGGSHHQKVVVIDDRVAFVGGFDLSRARWDTPYHIVNDPRRLDPPEKIYDPFHDIQVMVDGGAARKLGDLFRRRWYQAEGEKLASSISTIGDPWPSDIAPDLQDVDVAIARTEPEYDGNPEVREVERLYLDAVYLAQDYIYGESQYMTSASVCAALGERLKERNGPEVLFVVPQRSSGWIEESIMDSRRAISVERLRRADSYGRLGIYYPVLPGLTDGDMVIHSKLLIVDDVLVRVGSSNLSNRSMGLDTECDLAIESGGRAEVERSIAGLRNKLLGEHLGVSPDAVADVFQRTGSLLRTVEELRGPERTLKPLDIYPTDGNEFLTANVIDAEGPILPQKLIEELVPRVGRSDWLKLAGIAIVLAALATLWQWGPLGEWVDVDTLVGWGFSLRESPAAAVIVPAAYVIGGLAMMPLVLLVAATAVVFNPIESVVYAYAGSLASASVLYWIGREVGRDALRRLTGHKLNKINKFLTRGGVLTVATIRLVPVAPYTVVNMVLGASKVGLFDYIIGTAIGLAPGIIAISVFTDSVRDAVVNPSPKSATIVAVIIIAICLGSLWLKRRLSAREFRADASKSGRSSFD